MRFYISFLLLVPFCSYAQSPLFTLLPPSQTGINFQNTIKESAELNVLTYEYFYNGGGVAVGDLNNDGLPDIVFTANMDQPKVYFNKGGLKFEDVSKQSKVRATGWKTGVTLADVNADGWLDIYICRSGNGDDDSRRNLLFINQKNGTFKEEAAKYGVDDKGNSTQAVFFDFNGDGLLDLFILNHSTKRYKNFDVAYMKSAHDSLAGDKLYKNDGNGHFTDISNQAGIIGNPICFGLGVAVADFNGDGWPDMYVSNDYDEDDYLYINQKDGTFKEALKDYIGHTSKFSMGCDVADINDDGMTDLFTLDMLPEDNKRQKLLKGPDGYDHFEVLINAGYYYQYMRNMLQVAGRYNNKIKFSEVGQLAGISNTDWSWSALFADYDLDGWQDLFITNGYMRDYTNMDFLKYTAPTAIKSYIMAGQKPDMYEVVKKMPSSQVKSYLYKNKGNLNFENVSKQWGMDMAALSNGAAYADLDNDGDLDLIVNNINQPAFIWQNHAEDLKNNYLKIKFAGTKNNPFGIGTKVLITADSGFKQLQELELSHGFQSSVEPCLTFGLGKRKTADLVIYWQDGKTQKMIGQAVNRTIVVDYRNANNDNSAKEAEPKRFFTEIGVDSPMFRHREDDYNDFKREPLLPRQYSKQGPALVSGDVNGDGKKDFYIGGGKGQCGAIFINEGNGKFTQKQIPAFDEQSNFEDVNAVFADLDGDGDQDLYVVSGGNQDNFQDHIYWNDGKGNFTYKPNILPETTSSGGSVVVFNIENDAPLIFRSGQVATGSYPTAPRSYLFKYENGVYKDITPGFLKNIGMVCTSEVADINRDGINDLIIAGEFMPVTILFGQKEMPYFSTDHEKIIPNSSGWWNCLKIADMNNDGYLDIVAGNEGLNNQMKPSPTQPVTIDAADIDNNGSMDAVISYYIQGKSYPMPSRDELLDQVPSLKAKFTTYDAYSNATIKDIFTGGQLKSALHLEAQEFRSGIFINDNGSFHFQPFDNQAQAFPIRDVVVEDFDHDGLKDLLLAGNDFAVRAESGREDAGKGLLLFQNKNHGFTPVQDNGFLVNRDVRKIIKIDNYIIVANNNDKTQIFRIN